LLRVCSALFDIQGLKILIGYASKGFALRLLLGFGDEERATKSVKPVLELIREKGVVA
jgi:hypothetical protein